MVKLIVYLLFFLSFLYSSAFNLIGFESWESSKNKNDSTFNQNRVKINSLSSEVYREALLGIESYSKNNTFNDSVIAIVDFDLPSTQKRMFIIDIKNKKLLYLSLVAHGRMSGGNYAQEFSNINGSHQSSLGFFKTSEKYIGKHGLSLRLDGLEKGINDKARERNIVIHGADYVSEEFIKKNNRLGRSWGCPALPIKDYNTVLDYLDDEIILYIHASKK